MRWHIESFCYVGLGNQEKKEIVRGINIIMQSELMTAVRQYDE
jgi:hypothetical protein